MPHRYMCGGSIKQMLEQFGRFEESTISKEVSDLGSVIDAFNGRAIGYVGHSMGGAVGALRASTDARIKAMVSLAGMVQISEFMDTHFGALVPDADNMLDREGCPLTSAFLADAHEIGSTLEAAAAAATAAWRQRASPGQRVPRRGCVLLRRR